MVAVATRSPCPALPADSVLLPLASGRLLVSRGHAVFCRVPPEDVPVVEAVLAGQQAPDVLAPGLRAALERHGFFDGPRPAPPPTPSVQLQLTNGCNLECAYCCTNSGRPRRAELDLAKATRIVEEARAALGPQTRVALLGGEPFLVPWAIDLAEAIVRLDLSLAVFTNGIPLAAAPLAARAAALTRAGAEVRVSLAGPTAAICDVVSGTDRFEAALAGVDAVARAGGTVIVDLMLLPQHVEDVADHLPDLRRRLPAGTKITLGILYLSGRERGAHLFGSRAELEAALDRVAFGAGEVIPATPPSALAERREGCGCALGHHLHVRSDGALFTCFKMEEQVGDLAATGFAAALREVRERPHPAATLAACADCALNTICGGGCRSENLQYTGSAEQPVCDSWRVRVLSELLAEDRVAAVEWPVPHLLAEARRRGIAAPARIEPVVVSRHLVDT
jgi:radical SAM protein with 4Fe4S-binding SPASM domain